MHMCVSEGLCSCRVGVSIPWNHATYAIIRWSVLVQQLHTIMRMSRTLGTGSKTVHAQCSMFARKFCAFHDTDSGRK